jgi:16S rRNA (guanine1207-N2)-methyltransferase
MAGLTVRAVAGAAAAARGAQLLLQIGCDHADAMALLGRSAAPAAERRSDPIARNGNAAAAPDLSAEDLAADIIVLWAPGIRNLARRRLAELTAARPQKLIVIGTRDDGIEPLVRDTAAVFTAAMRTESAGGFRTTVFSQPRLRPDLPTWLQDDGIRPGSFHHFSVPDGPHHLLLSTLPGVFSSEHLDPGSSLLLDVLAETPLPAGRVLDLGCGAGVLGLAAARRGADVLFSDINALAVRAAEHNLQQLGLRGVVRCGDGWAGLEGQRFAMILCNPPFHHQAGQQDLDASAALLSGLRDHLTPDGQALIVANRFLPYERLFTAMFTAVERRRATNHYTVWQLAGPRAE